MIRLVNAILFSNAISEWKFKISYMIYILGAIFLVLIFIWIKYQEYKSKKYCEKHDIKHEDNRD